jgi:formylglycine-generating enzyme required for sulfatase activity
MGRLGVGIASVPHHFYPTKTVCRNGATWRRPWGNETDVFEAKMAWHPAVHVSLRDAERYCAWAREGGRLPTENEFEAASRGGKANRMFAWGNVLTPRGEHRANLWQGEFPHGNLVEDGFAWTAPVDAFGPQNALGFHGIVGNVWEWTSSEWCDPKRPAPDCWRQKVKGRPSDPGEVEYVKRGGSFLCHISYCYRYRVASRTKNTANSAAINIGFRCARDAPTSHTQDPQTAARIADAYQAAHAPPVVPSPESPPLQQEAQLQEQQSEAQAEDGDCGCTTSRADTQDL